ncbi:trifunctional dihydropteroate synthetase [Puccinia graminis f. sp. tritici]|uniref:2-amino-4-hydroxy-6-hydroxymethyldihydropteridine diphosphokinase n=1 Tax=Puccinia graminis f. sp. tritici TaxID=56615 RepID=A0A5B0RHC0_PUCGR|nr:trifunctional dihydropteroate synthetase [Puccinia graminis f. sp. tritici]
MSIRLLNPARSSSLSRWIIHPGLGRIPTRNYSSGKDSSNIVYLGLGSNIGDRLKNISNALQSLSNHDPSTRVLDSSFVYQSQPMYVTDQPEFLNATCKISTPLSPQELLKIIKRIEADQGRILENVPRNGPRPIDIDILLYNSEIIRQDNLTIPHIGILERQFVLDPLIESVDPARQLTLFAVSFFSN